MPRPRYLVYDNLDDRREVHLLLAGLSPRSRIRFLADCCRAAVLPGSAVHPRVSRKTLELAELARYDSSADRRLSVEVYFDLWKLASHYNFDIDQAVALLEKSGRTANRERYEMSVLLC